MHKKYKFIVAFILVSSMLLSVGCSKQENSNQNTSTKQSDNTVVDDGYTYGKVTVIDGNKITINVGSLNNSKGTPPNGTNTEGERPEMPKGEMPQGERPEMPNGEAPQMSEGERPEMSQGERPEMPEGENAPQNKSKDLITLTDEEKVIEISHNVVISQMSFKNKNTEANEESTSLKVSDIKVGDTIKIGYNDDKTTVKSVEIMSMPEKKESEKKEATT